MVPTPSCDTHRNCSSAGRQRWIKTPACTQRARRLAVLCLVLCSVVCARNRPGDWSGPYPPCDRHRELTKKERMNLGVRFYTSDPELRAAFAQAMDFWAAVLDLTWYEEDSRNCAMQVVDGHGGLFKPAEIARSQFPGRRTFQGWIAFNPKAELTLGEKYSVAVHEVGHMLG